MHLQFSVGRTSPWLQRGRLKPIGTTANGYIYDPRHPDADERDFRRDLNDALKSPDVSAARLSDAVITVVVPKTKYEDGEMNTTLKEMSWNVSRFKKMV